MHGAARLTLMAALAAGLLAGCNRPEGAAAPGDHGRYIGIGVFEPGELWAKVAAPDPSPDAAAAKPGDDEHVIVVVDSKTGEIRECGDLSGACVSMNPWTKAIAPGRSAPVKLTARAGQAQPVPADPAR